MQDAITQFWRRVPGRKWLIWGAGAFVLYLVVGFFLIPPLVKWQLLKHLPPAAHRMAGLRQVKFNPLTLALTLRGLTLVETNGDPFASFEELYVNFQLSSLFRLAWTFNEISLKEPRVEMILDRNGRFNFANLFESSSSAPKPKQKRGGVPRLLVFDLGLTNGHVGFADLTHKTPFRTAYEPINFQLKQFSTKPDRQSPYSFEASSDSGRRVAWAGTVSAQPLSSSGTLQVTGIRLPKHAPYIEDFTRAQLVDGTLDVAGNYSLVVGTNRTDLVATNVTLTVTKLNLKDPATSEDVVVVPSLQIRGGTFDLSARQVRAVSMLVTNPTLLVRRQADGVVNIPSLVIRHTVSSATQTFQKEDRRPAPAEAPWIFTLDDYQLQDGAVQFEDATVPGPFRSLLKPVAVHVRHFSTATNAETAVEVEVTSDASEAITLKAAYSLSPPRGGTALKLTGLELKRYQPYLTPVFRGIIAAGKLDIALDFNHEMAADALQAVLTNTTVQVSGLEIRSPDGSQAVASVPRFAIENSSGSLAEKAVHITGIKANGVAVHVEREADGAINLTSLMVAKTNSPARTNQATTSSSTNWSVALDEFAFRDGAVQFTDRQVPKPAELKLDQLEVALHGVQFPSNAPVAAEFATRVNGAGKVAVDGKIWPQSRTADAKVAVDGLELRGFQPWLEQHIKLAIESGALHTQGQVELAASDAGKSKLHIAGTLGVRDLKTVDQVLFKELAKWDELEIKGIDVNLQPNKAAVEQVMLSGFRTSIILDAQKRLNLRAIRPPAATNSAAPAPTEPSTPPATGTFPFQLGELKLQKTSILFRDESVQPPCAFDLQQLDGVVKGLSTDANSTADVDLSGRVDESSPFSLRGKVNPLARDLQVDLVFTNHNLQLTPFTPYLEKYAGHPLNKGRLSLNLNYGVHAKQLKAQNKVQIDQLMLGPRNDSPEATKLPVKLGVALLKDSNGRIDLDVPVEGRLDDPQFGVGRVILKVIGNLITKAAASPFKLLGALVGGGEELSFVEFDPGTATLLASETNKLDRLVQALEKRPALSLEIEGSADPSADRDALARGLVKDQVRLQRVQELSAIGQGPTSAENIQIDTMNYDRLLRSLVVKTCGTNLAEALRVVAERAAAATNRSTTVQPTSRGPGFFARVGSVFKPGKERSATRHAHQAAKADALLLQQNPDLGRLTAEDMETLLAAQTDVPPERLQQLMQDRAKVVQSYLTSAGKLAAERLFLVKPKTGAAAAKGESRVRLALN